VPMGPGFRGGKRLVARVRARHESTEGAGPCTRLSPNGGFRGMNGGVSGGKGEVTLNEVKGPCPDMAPFAMLRVTM